MIEKLLSDDVLACMIVDKEFCNVASDHLDISFLPTKQHQSVFQAIRHSYFKSDGATWGGIYEAVKADKDACELVVNLKKLDVHVKSATNSFESFLLDKKFRKSYNKMGELYRSGKHEEAQTEMNNFIEYKESLSISSEMVKGLMESMDETEAERKLIRTSIPLPTGIAPLDYYTYGGIRRKEFWCIMADSGGGKSTMLRYIGIQALLQGKKVLHFQAEDSREACLDLYKSTLLGVNSSSFMFNSFDAKKNKEIDAKIAEFKKTLISDLYVHAFEEFGSGSMNDCYNIAKKMEKKHGKFDLLIFDYLDEFEVGDGKTYSTNNEGVRAKKSAVGKQMKNIAMELDVPVITATQSNDIKPEDKNNVGFVLTRNNIADNKALIRQMNLFCTISQTFSEVETNKERPFEVARLFIDKYRTGKDKILFTIAQNRNSSQFYDNKNTCDNYWDEITKSPKIYIEQ